MIVYTLTRKKYASELSGVGASKFGNRWNSKGTEILYTSSSRALAMAEVAVHLSFELLPKDYQMLAIEIPSNASIKVLNAGELPSNWHLHPPIPQTQKIGDAFIHQQEYLVLKVPSAVVAGDINFLINPHHSQFSAVKISERSNFPFDTRLFKT